jgi:hypothetical protein
MTSLSDWPVAIRTPAPGAELTAWPNGVCQQLEHLSAFHDRVDRLAELIAKTTQTGIALAARRVSNPADRG